MKRTALNLCLLLACATHASAVEAVTKNGGDNTLTEPLATGPHSLKISAMGTLIFDSASDIAGAEYVKAALDLEHVENTALSTWAGSANVTTLGTVGTGTWHGTAIADGYIASAATWNAKQTAYTILSTLGGLANSAGVLTNNGIGVLTWTATSDGTNGITDANKLVRFDAGAVLNAPSMSTNSIALNAAFGGGILQFTNTNGTSFTLSMQDVSNLTADSLVQLEWPDGGGLFQFSTPGSVITDAMLGAGVYAALAGAAVNTSGGMLTYGIIGSSGAKVPLLNAANTFSANQRINGRLGVGDVAPSSALHVRAETNDEFDGIIFQPNNQALTTYLGYGGMKGNLLGMTSTGDLQLRSGNSSYVRIGGTDYRMLVDGVHSSIVIPSFVFGLGFDHSGPPAHQFGLKGGAAAIYNAFTSVTEWEAMVIKWSGNVAFVGTDIGSGGGTARDVQFIRGGVGKVTIGVNTTEHAQPVKLPSYIVSGLPSAATCGVGSMACVTDATLTTPYTAVIGGGSNKVLVVSDGTDWIIH